MKKLLILLAIIAPMCLFAQNEESRNLKSFDAVSVSQSIKLTLVKGNENKAVVKTDGELSEVITKVDGDRLLVKKESKNNWSGGNKDNVEVVVTYSGSLNSLSASSSSSMMVEGTLNADDLSVKCSSSAKIMLKAEVSEAEISASSSSKISAQITADEVEVKVSSSAKIDLSGSSNEFEASVSSSGSLKGSDFLCEKADVKASSSGSIYLGVKNELEASASSSGKVVYYGNPRMKDLNISSGGRVKSAE